MGDFELVDKPKKQVQQFEVNFDDEPQNAALSVKLTYTYKVILLRRFRMNGQNFSFNNQMSTGKRLMDDGKDIKMGTNIFGMNFVPPDSAEHKMIYPPDRQDVKYIDVNEVDRDSTESMLLGIDYELRNKPNFSGITKEQEEEMAKSGMVNFWENWQWNI